MVNSKKVAKNDTSLGSVDQAKAANDAGRGEKRPERLTRSVARDFSFHELCDLAHPKEVLIKALDSTAYDGELVVVELKKEVFLPGPVTIYGRVLFEIILDRQDRPAVQVFDSDFLPIRTSRVFLPLNLLLREEYRQYLPNVPARVQLELYHALRFALGEEIEAYLSEQDTRPYY